MPCYFKVMICIGGEIIFMLFYYKINCLGNKFFKTSGYDEFILQGSLYRKI